MQNVAVVNIPSPGFPLLRSSEKPSDDIIVLNEYMQHMRGEMNICHKSKNIVISSFLPNWFMGFAILQTYVPTKIS